MKSGTWLSDRVLAESKPVPAGAVLVTLLGTVPPKVVCSFSAAAAIHDCLGTAQAWVRTFPIDAQGRELGAGSPLPFEADHEVPELRDDLVRRVTEVVPDAHLHGAPQGPGRLPGNAHLGFPGCEGDSLLMLLDARGIECSTGSACSAGVPQPSHVLLAMGCSDEQARHSLRFSLGHTSTQSDVDALVAAIGPVVERARQPRRS